MQPGGMAEGLSNMATDSSTIYRSQIGFRVGSGTLVETVGNLSNGPFATLETLGHMFFFERPVRNVGETLQTARLKRWKP